MGDVVCHGFGRVLGLLLNPLTFVIRERTLRKRLELISKMVMDWRRAANLEFGVSWRHFRDSGR